MEKYIKQFAAGTLSLAMVFGFVAAPAVSHAALSESQIQSILSLLSSFGAEQSVIDNVSASLRGEATSGGNTSGGSSSASVCPFTWTRSLSSGDSGADVLALQQFLNSDSATMIAASGVGSAGNETNYFGSLTAKAVSKFQNKYASEILTPLGLSAGTGYFGASTRAKANSLCASGSSNNNGGSSNNGGNVSGTAFNVSLDANSPNNVALVQGQALGELAVFDFSNPTNSEVSVTGLTFNRIGVSNDSTIANVYLYDGATRLTDSAGVSNSQFSFNAPNGIFKVPANSMKRITVRADISSGTNGQQIGASLVSVSLASGSLDSSVSLPIMGHTQTISAATLATADFGSTTLPSSSTVDPQDDYVVWQNTVTIGNTAVDLKSLALENIGSVNPGDVVNFRLYVDGTQYGSAVAQMNSDDMVIFDLSSSPALLQTGGRVLKVVADIVGGSGDTFQMSLRRTGDVLLQDTELNQPVLPTANGSTFSARSATSATVNSGTVSVVKAANSPSASVAVDATNVKWASFELRATGENVKVDNLDVKAVTTGAAGGLNNGKVFLNGVQVGSTKDLTNNTDVNFTFGSSFILQQGEVAVVDIYADAKTTTSASYSSGNTVTVSLGAGSSNGEGVDSKTTSNVPGSDVAGNQITLSSSALTATKYSGYGNQTMIPGSNNARLGSFTLSAGSTEGLNVNTIVVNLSSAEAATVTDLMLKDHATGAQIGTTKASPSTGNSFSVNFDIPASGTKTIDLYGNIKSGSNSGSWQADIDSTTGATGMSTGNSVTVGSDVNLQTITVGSGSLTASLGAGDPNSDNVIAGSSSVLAGEFNFAAANSSYTVRELKIKVPNGGATSVTNVTLKYKSEDGSDREVTQALAVGSQAYATATFTGLDFYVPRDDDANLDVYVGIPTIANGATSGAAVSVDLDYNEGFKATDDAGTTLTSVGSADMSAGGVFYPRKSIPTFSRVDLSNTPASGIALYKFTVSADAANDIEWKKVSFTVTTSGVTATNWTLYDVTGGSATAVNSSAANLSGTTLSIYAGSSSSNDVEKVSAGGSKTYELRAASVAGWGNSGDSLTIELTSDGSHLANGSSQGMTGNVIWSDRSATSHTTITSDWTNGYLLDDFVNDVESYTVTGS